MMDALIDAWMAVTMFLGIAVEMFAALVAWNRWCERAAARRASEGPWGKRR